MDGLEYSEKVKDEYLKGGQSITKAIVMGGRGCCGGAYVERVS